MKQTTVLGARGFIGSRLSAELRRRGFGVATPGRDADLSQQELGAVFYCIGLTGDAQRRPAETVEAHVVKLAEVLRDCRFDELVYLSSTRLYLGAETGGEDAELRSDPLDPGRLFNLSKSAGEALVLQTERPRRVARLSNVYGSNWGSANFLSTVISAACRDGVVRVHDAPESAKDYVHVDDVVDALIHIALEGRQPVYNVASGRNVSHREITEALQALTGCAIETGSRPRAVVYPPIETGRLQAELPFSPRKLLDDLPELVEDCRAWLKRSGAPVAER